MKINFKAMSSQMTIRYLFVVTVITAGYFIGGVLGLNLAIKPGFATVIWPSSGIALGALIVLGIHYWPGVFLGGFLIGLWKLGGIPNTNVFQELSIMFVITLGATLQASIGTWLIRKYNEHPIKLITDQSIGNFILFGGVLSSLVNATISIGYLLLTGIITIKGVYINWFTWWVGDAIGILIFAPLVLLFFARPREIWRDRILACSIPVVIVFILVLFISYFSQQAERIRKLVEFEQNIHLLGESLEIGLQNHKEILNSIEYLFISSESIDRHIFRDFVVELLNKNDAVHAISWNPLVIDSNRQEYEDDMRNEGFTDFTITERDESGNLIVAEQRDYYVTVKYIEPFEDNIKAFGFDVNSNLDRREALDTASLSNKAIATRRIKLIQETGGQYGFLVFLPIYHQTDPKNLIGLETKQNVRGYVTGVFRVGDVIIASMPEIDPDEYRIWVIDRSSDIDVPELIYTNTQQDHFSAIFPDLKHGPDSIHTLYTINFADRSWQLIAKPGAQYWLSEKSWSSYFILITGLLFTASLVGFMLVLTGRNTVIRHEIDKKTQDLQITNIKLKEEILQRKRADERVVKHQILEEKISYLLREFIKKERLSELFDNMLSVLLEVSESEYGFIGDVYYDDNDQPYLKTYAITNIAWNEETRKFYEENAPEGLVFTNLDTLFGYVMTSQEIVISNDPANDPRAGGIPEGHPGLNTFLGVPFKKHGKLVGMMGMANHSEGYDQSMLNYLEPLIEVCTNIRMLVLAQQVVEDNEHRLNEIIWGASVGTWEWNAEIGKVQFNETWAEMLGYSLDELKAEGLEKAWLTRIHQEDLKQANELLEKHITGDIDYYESEVRMCHKDGSWVWLLDRGKLLQTTNDGKPLRISGTYTDITKHKNIEEQLRQSQKLEAVGQLTGGIAHDFNNLLGIVLGNIELLKQRLDFGDSRSHGYVENALGGVQRGATLTQRLLAFSRKQMLSPDVLDLNVMIRGMTELLQRTLEEHIEIEVVSAAGLWTCFADKIQMENVLLNLALNARDSMPSGGRLTIETANVWLDDTYCEERVDVVPGQYVMLAVTDSGMGMSKQTLAHVYDPFFTTKRVGQGSGLGLSMAFGFAKQSRGHINIYSEQGQGTCVKFYQPRYRGPEVEPRTAPIPDVVQASVGCIFQA